MSPLEPHPEPDDLDLPSDRGLCDMCEKMPATPDEPVCALCRVELTAASEIISDPVERLLSQHQHVCQLSNIDRTLCRCGKQFDGGPGYHRRHMAEIIRAALGLDPPVPWIPASDEIEDA